jgi:hypothetical protein
MRQDTELTPEMALAKINAMHEFSESHPEAWKNELAHDLNHLMGRAVWWLETDRDEIDIKFGIAVVRVVERVAEFEELLTTEGKPVAITTLATFAAGQQLKKVKDALRAYHNALDTRKNGDIASDHLVKAVESALHTPWVRGATVKQNE